MKSPLPRGSWLVTMPLLAVGLGYYFFWFSPQAEKIERLRDELRATAQSTGDAQRLAAEVRPARQRLQSTEEYVNTWRARLIEEDAVAHVYARLARLAEQSGVQPGRIAPETATRRQSLVEVPLKLEFSGRFASCVKFLSEIDRQEPFVWVEELQMSRPAGDDAIVACQVKLVVFAGQSNFSG